MALQREQVVQTAEKFVSRGKIEPAIREYRKLLVENPNDINTLNRVGDLYARIQRIDEAVDFFNQIGEQYSSQGFFVKAIAIYKKVIKLDPTRLDIYERLADLYHKQNLVTEARTQYQVLADYYTKHENAPSAISIYNKMADLEPDNPSYHVKLAEIYHQQKLFEKAINEYRIIAELMIKHGRTQDAAQVYERALGIDSQNLRFIADAVDALRDAGDEAAAAHFLSVAIERNPAAEQIASDTSRRRKPEPEPEPEPEQEMTFEVEVEAAASTALNYDDDASIELEIDLGDDLMVAMREAEASVAGTGPSTSHLDSDLDSDEVEIDLDSLEELVVELPEDDSPSLVKPPPDLRGAAVRPAWASRDDDAAALEIELEDSLTLEPLEIEGLAAEPLRATPSAPTAPTAPIEAFPGPESFAEAEAFTLDADIEIEALPWESGTLDDAPAGGAAVVESIASRQQEEAERDELVTEAEVLAKYGLEDKAMERLDEALRNRPDSLAAHALLIKLHLNKGRYEQVFALARRLFEISTATGTAEPWQSVRARLVEAGYQLRGNEVVAGPHGLSSPVAAPTPPAPVVPEPEPELPALVDFPEEALSSLEPALGEPVLDELVFEEGLLEEPALETPAVEEPVLEALPDELLEMDLGPAEEMALEEAAPPVASAPAPAPAPAPVEPPPPPPPARPSSPPPPATPWSPASSRGVDTLLRGLLHQDKPARKPGAATPPPRPLAPPASPAPQTPAAAPSVQAAAPPVQTTAPAPPAPAAAPPPTFAKGALFDLTSLGSMIEDEEAGVAPSGPIFPAAVPGVPDSAGWDALAAGNLEPQAFEDSGVDWLDETASRRAAAPAPAAPGAESAALFDEEDDFFDLAGELVEELSREEVFQDGSTVQAEQSLEEIVEGFKKGVAEHLSPTDYDTHYNLGIAYREMGLLDEAIGEFQLAAKDSRYLVICCSMLGLCFLDKGLPELAVKWYRRGMEAPNLVEDDRLGLMYDMGDAYQAMGDAASAYATFVELYGINTHYRDIVAKIEELRK